MKRFWSVILAILLNKHENEARLKAQTLMAPVTNAVTSQFISALYSHVIRISIVVHIFQNALIYTVGHKKGATFIFTITLSNVDRFQ